LETRCFEDSEGSFLVFLKADNINKLVINVIIFIVLMIVNSYIPYFDDDFSLRLLADGTRIESFSDIFSNIVFTYFNRFGRIIPVGLGSVFLLFDKSVFNYINSFLTLVYLNYLAYKIGNKKYYLIALTLLFSIMWFFIPNIIGVVFWVSASVEYWFPTMALTSFLVAIENDSFDNYSFFKLMSISLITLVISFMVEITGVILVFYFIVTILESILTKKKQSITLKLTIPLSFSILGTLLVIYAPGNASRIALSNIDFLSVLAQLMFNFIRAWYYFFVYGYTVIFSLILIMVLGFTKADYSVLSIYNKSNNIKQFMVYGIVIFFSISVLTFSSGFSVRVLTPLITMVIILMVKVLVTLFDRNPFTYKKVSIFLNILLLFAVIINLMNRIHKVFDPSVSKIDYDIHDILIDDDVFRKFD
jgi:hypothetical protein